MAKDKKNFELKKGGEHSFDISKGGKRKFDLSKDSDDEVTVSASQPTPQPVPEPSEPGVKKHVPWMWIVVIIALIIFLLLWLIPSGNKDDQNGIMGEGPGLEQTDEATDNSPGMTENVDEEPVALTEDEQNETVSETMDSPEQSESVEETKQAQTTASMSTSPAISTAPAASPAASASTVSDNVEAEALKVIRGDYGIGQERKQKLGAQYRAIQERVNQMKREGLF